MNVTKLEESGAGKGLQGSPTASGSTYRDAAGARLGAGFQDSRSHQHHGFLLVPKPAGMEPEITASSHCEALKLKGVLQLRARLCESRKGLVLRALRVSQKGLLHLLPSAPCKPLQ